MAALDGLRRLGPALLVAALLAPVAACRPKGAAGPTPAATATASVPTATTPAGSAPAPEPSLQAPVEPAPDGSSGPAASGASLELRIEPPSAMVGSKLVLAIRNAGREPFVYVHPGGNNGCEAFRWSVALDDGQGLHYDTEDPSPHPCTAVMVPPREIRIQPGEVVKVPFDTDREFFVLDARLRIMTADNLPRRPLPPGKYSVVVSGLDAPLVAPLELLPRAP